METTDRVPPEGTADWDPQLGPRAEKHAKKLEAGVRKILQTTKQIREALSLSSEEFDAFVRVDEYDGLPQDFHPGYLTITKLQDFLEERGGFLEIRIILNDVEHIISA